MDLYFNRYRSWRVDTRLCASRFFSEIRQCGQMVCSATRDAHGIPLYSNAAGVIPLVSALTEKGVAMGTTLAFMMAVTGLSLPEFMILKKVMKTKLILIFAGIVGIGIISTGYLFNLVLS